MAFAFISCSSAFKVTKVQPKVNMMTFIMTSRCALKDILIIVELFLKPNHGQKHLPYFESISTCLNVKVNILARANICGELGLGLGRLIILGRE